MYSQNRIYKQNALILGENNIGDTIRTPAVIGKQVARLSVASVKMSSTPRPSKVDRTNAELPHSPGGITSSTSPLNQSSGAEGGDVQEEYL